MCVLFHSVYEYIEGPHLPAEPKSVNPEKEYKQYKI